MTTDAPGGATPAGRPAAATTPGCSGPGERAPARPTVRVALRVGDQVTRYDVPTPIRARDQVRLVTTLLKRLQEGLAPFADARGAAIPTVGRTGG